MLEHADRGDLVVAAVEVPIVPELDRNAPFEPLLRHARDGEVELLLRQGHPMRDDPVMLGGIGYETAPSAAYVEKAFARLQPELAADHLEFRILGIVEGRFGPSPIGAGVGHGRAQEERIERVGDVVVELHEGLVVATLLDGILDTSFEAVPRPRIGLRNSPDQERPEVSRQLALVELAKEPLRLRAPPAGG